MKWKHLETETGGARSKSILWKATGLERDVAYFYVLNYPFGIQENEFYQILSNIILRGLQMDIQFRYFACLVDLQCVLCFQMPEITGFQIKI